MTDTLTASRISSQRAPQGLLASMTPHDGDSNPETDESEAYADDTPLTWVFGNHPEPKLIAAFLSERNRDVNVTTIAAIAGLSRGAVYNHLDDLRDYGIIEPTREMGGGQLFQIDTDNDYTRLLFELERQLLDEWYGSVDPDAPLDGDTSIESAVAVQDPVPDVDEPYAEGTPLTQVLGEHPEVKIIAALLSEHTRDISVTDIARLGDVSRNDVYDHLETLLTHDLVEQTRTLGPSKLYTIDATKRSIQLIDKLEDQLLLDWYERREIV